MTDYEECDRCGRDAPPENIQSVSLVDEWEVCDGCVEDLNDSIEFYDWQDRYTEEQHERALTLFSEIDEIDCVISDYENGQIVIHTSYVASDVIDDFCNHFGFEIKSFGPQWEQKGGWPCMSDHGSTFQIMLEYNHRSNPPIPTSVIFEDNRIDGLDEHDEQF